MADWVHWKGQEEYRLVCRYIFSEGVLSNPFSVHWGPYFLFPRTISWWTLNGFLSRLAFHFSCHCFIVLIAREMTKILYFSQLLLHQQPIIRYFFKPLLKKPYLFSKSSFFFLALSSFSYSYISLFLISTSKVIKTHCMDNFSARMQ